MALKITQVLTSVGLACDYYTDSAAMDGSPPTDGLFVRGEPVTPGFAAIHERARCLNLQLVLDDGSVALGDCLSVIRSGAHDRAAPFSPETYEPLVARHIAPRLVDRPVTGFRPLAAMIDELDIDGLPLHPGLAYGLSQAVLHAASLATRRSMAEVLVDEYDLRLPDRPISMLGCTDWRQAEGVDRLIAGRAQALPHGGFTTVDSIGTTGDTLVAFVAGLAARVAEFSDSSYRPTVHLDVYGTIGRICDGDPARMTDYLRRLIAAAAPLPVRIEDPVGAASADASRAAMQALVARVDAEALPVEVIADEYCNTRDDIARWAQQRAAHLIHVKPPDLGSLARVADAILDCRRAGVRVYVGGTMNDTEVSARAGLHVALAFGADLLMAKPGAAPDVSLALTRNEMGRTIRLCAARAA